MDGRVVIGGDDGESALDRAPADERLDRLAQALHGLT